MSDGRRGILARFDPIPGQERPRPLRNGLILLAVLGLVALIVLGLRNVLPIPLPEGGEVVEADFDRALYMGQDKAPTPVRVHGVDVGKVESVELLPGGRGVRAQMRLDDDIDLHSDARAAAYERTLLGFNFYVELDPGSPSAPPLGDRPIPRSRTQTQVELDEVVSALDEPARRAVQQTFEAFDQGFANPRAAGEALEWLGPATRNVGPAASAFRGMRPGEDLPALVSSTSRVMGALARTEQQLAGLIDGAEITLGVTAARRSDLGSLLRQAPATMREVRLTGARLRRTLDQLDPVAQALQPGARRLDDAARRLEPVLRTAVPLLRDARPLLRELRPAVRHLGGAARSGEPLLRGLDITLTRLRSELIPWFDGRDDEIGLKPYQMIGPAVSAVQSGGTGYFDAYGHIISLPAGFTATRSVRTFPCDTQVFEGGELAECRAIGDTLRALIEGRPPPEARSDASAGGR